MRKSTWKKLVSFMLVAALIIGSVHLSNNKVKAEDLISGVGADQVKATNPAIQYTLDRNTVVDKIAAPINIVLLFDASNSMVDNNKDNGKRLDNAKDAAKKFVESLVTDDNFTPTFYLITFNKDASCVQLTGDLEAMQKQIDDITAAQGTNLKAAAEAVPGNLAKDSTFVIILSDGEASVAEIDGTLYSSFTFVDGTSSTIDNGKAKIKPATETALTNAKDKVKDLYAIRVGATADQEKIISDVINNSNKVIDVKSAEDAAGLKDAFGIVAKQIKKYATLAQIIAEKGKYVDFVADPEHEEVYSGTYTFKDETVGTKDVIFWDIADPDTEKTGTENGILSPVVNFTINKSAAELYALGTGENPDPQIKIIPIEDSNAVKIQLDVTAYTVLKYTQVEDGVEVEKEVPVRAFVTLTAYEATEVPYDVTYVYYENNEEVVIDSYEGKTLDNEKIIIPRLTEEQFTEKELDSKDFSYREGNVFDPTVGVDNHSFVIILDKAEPEPEPEPQKSTVMFIVEGKEVYNKTEEVGTPIEKPVDPTKEADDDYTYSFKGWSLDQKEVVEKVAEKFEEADLTYYALFDAKEIKKDIPVPPTPKTSTVKFIVEGTEVYNKTEEVGTPIEKPADPTKEADDDYTYSFKGWSFDGKEVVEKVADKFEEADLTYYAVFDATPIEKEEDPTPTPEQKKNDPPIIYYVADPTPVPTADPTPVPTAEPTPEPTQVPEEIEEAPEVPENVEVEIPETPEGEPEEIEIPEEPETPEGTPDDIEVELPDVPEGLPQTGTAPVAVFFGIGAACIILGGAMIVKIRRREEEM